MDHQNLQKLMAIINERTSTAILAPNNTMVVPNNLKHEQVASDELEDFPVESQAQTVDYEDELEAFDTYMDATFDWPLNDHVDTFDNLQLDGEPKWPLQHDAVDTIATVVTTANARTRDRRRTDS